MQHRWGRPNHFGISKNVATRHTVTTNMMARRGGTNICGLILPIYRHLGSTGLKPGQLPRCFQNPMKLFRRGLQVRTSVMDSSTSSLWGQSIFEQDVTPDKLDEDGFGTSLANRPTLGIACPNPSQLSADGCRLPNFWVLEPPACTCQYGQPEVAARSHRMPSPLG